MYKIKTKLGGLGTKANVLNSCLSAKYRVQFVRYLSLLQKNCLHVCISLNSFEDFCKFIYYYLNFTIYIVTNE